MKCFAPASAFVLSTALLLAAIDALSIRSSDVGASSSSDAHQSLEKTWTVTSADQLRRVFVQVPGNVFVDYDSSLRASSASDVVAKIVVRSDSKELLDLYDVAPRKVSSSSDAVREDSVSVHLKNVDAKVQGHVFTQIYVADKSALHELSTAVTHNTVLARDVLASNDPSATIKLLASGSGNLFAVTQEAFAVQALKVAAAGSGDVQLSAASLRATDEIKVSLSGSGDVALQAPEMQSAKLESKVAGSGDVFVESDNLLVDDLASAVAGSGRVTLSKSGTCAKQSAHIAGSGAIETGSIVCRDTDVSIAGSGDVVLQSTETLDVSVIASGSVKYVNARPKSVQESSVFSHREVVKQADANAFKTYRAVAIPARSAIELELELRAQPFGDDPSIHVRSKAPVDDGLASTLSFATFYPSSSSSDASVASVVGVAGVAFAAVGALLRTFRQRKREEYAPLV